MELAYDEDLTGNSFLIEVQEQERLVEEATANRWKICVPCRDALQGWAIVTEADILGHVLVPETELPTTHFVTLAGDAAVYDADAGTLTVTAGAGPGTGTGSDGATPRRAHLLFRETFYAGTASSGTASYQVWCLDRPLTGSHARSHLRTNLVDKSVLDTFVDCVRFLWTEAESRDVLENIDAVIEESSLPEKLKTCDSVERAGDAVAAVYSECLAVAFSNRKLRSKAGRSSSFLANVRLAIETYVLHSSYREIFETIGAFSAAEDASFNKILRNLSDVQTKDLEIGSEYLASIPAAKKILCRVGSSRSVLEKIERLKKTISSVKNSSVDDPVRNFLSADDLLPILIFLVIKSNVPNWITQIKFLKHFRFSGGSVTHSDEFGYYVATLEAVIEHISRELSTTSLSESRTAFENEDAIESTSNSSRKLSETGSRRDMSFVGDPGTLNYLFYQIKLSNFDEIKNILDRNVNSLANVAGDSENLFYSKNSISIEEILNDDNSEDSRELCHPLCDCPRCSRIISKKVFTASPTVNSQDEYGFTALHVASVYGEPHIIDFLIEKGSDVNSVDCNGSTSLHYASSKGHQNAQLLLLNAGADLNKKNMKKDTPLHLACNNGHSNCVKALVYFAEHCPLQLDIDIENVNGETPLHLASKWGYEPIARLLLEHGANPWLKNSKGKTPIDVSQSTVMLKLLISTIPTFWDYDNISLCIDFPSLEEDDLTLEHETSTDDNKLNYIKELNPSLSIDIIRGIERLFCAISYGDTKLACFYLNIDQIPNRNKTSTSKNNIDLCHPLCTCENCVRKLNMHQDSGVIHLQASDAQGNTALHVAAKYGRLDMCKILLENGALIEAVNVVGYTPFHTAVKHSRLSVVELFIKQNININLKDNLGNTALHLACENDNVDMVELLLTLKPVLTKNVSGQTPLDIAQDRMHLTISTMIEERDLKCN